MEKHSNPTAQKLLRAFMQFKKIGWHQRSVSGYKPSEIRVLFGISKGARPDALEMKVSEISRLLHVTSPTVTQLLKGLEANGLVERHTDPTDRRAVAITLTPKGHMVMQEAQNMLLNSFNGLIEYLGEEQSSQLAELLDKTFRYFNEKEASVDYLQQTGDEA